MKKYIFIGANRVGKSNLILSIATVLAKLNKKVLVIDTTLSQGMKSFFDFNFQLEPKDPLRNLIPVVREEFNILFTDTVPENKFDFTKLNKINFDIYDYVFIEADKYLDKNLIHSAEKIYLLQDYDKDTLIKNKEMLTKFKCELSKLQIIFINKIENICDNMYFLSELIPCMNKVFKGRNDDIEIDFSEHDYANILESKIDGHIYLSDFSNEYKVSLFEIVNTITEVSPKKFQKVV